MYLFFDLETNGLPRKRFAPMEDVSNWPRIIQIAWNIYDKNAKDVTEKGFIAFPEDFKISHESSLIHGITDDIARGKGIQISRILSEFNSDLNRVETIISHNIDFDLSTINAEFTRNNIKTILLEKPTFCTMKSQNIIKYCRIPNPYGFGYKWPTLSELHQILFDEGISKSHNAQVDVKACARCFFELKKREII